MDKHSTKKAWYKRWWVWVIIVIVGIAVISSTAENKDKIGDKVNNASSEIKDTVSDAKKKIDDTKKADEPKVPAEYASALAQADTYANTMHMSKQGVYDQLTSEYGGKFSAEAAKYAIDHVKSDWNANALAKAKDYQKQQHLSPEAIRDQLTSSAGEKFTQAEADYAIAHLND